MKYGITFLALGLVCLGGVLSLETVPVRVLAAYTSFGFLAAGMGYLLRNPKFWLKMSDGTIHPIGYLLFGSLHVLNWLSLLLATRISRSEPCHEITPNLWLGRRLISSEALLFTTKPEWAVLDLTSEFAENRHLRRGCYLCLPTLDHTAPTIKQIEEALSFISEHVSKRTVLVHCALGHGRSATVIVAWVLRNGIARTIAEAQARLKEVRKGVGLEASQVCTLREMFPN